MIFHIGSLEVDTVKVRRWINSSRGRTLTFRLLIAAAVLLALAAWYAFGGRSGRYDEQKSVVLYTSADDAVVKLITDAFTAETGIEVKIVTDTEATRGAIVQRLISEKERPKADVFWGSDVMGAIRMSQEAALAPWTSAAEVQLGAAWPTFLRDPANRWYGFAQRARVIAFAKSAMTKPQVPTRLRDLTKPQWGHRVGMADPRFGTTRTHLAFMVWSSGADATKAWLTAMKANGLQIMPSNSAVAQALGRGDIQLGLTDTDDVWAAQRENWPVDLVYETPDKPREKFEGLKSPGPLVIPNTVGRVTGSPSSKAGLKLAEFLLSPAVEKMLVQSDSHNVPVFPAVVKEFPQYAVPNPAAVNYIEVAAAEADAVKIYEEVFGGG